MGEVEKYGSKDNPMNWMSLVPMHLALAMLACAAAEPPANPPFHSNWLRSYSPSINLTSSGGVLRWEQPKHFSSIFSYLPNALPLEKGHAVNLTMRWRSNGSDTCPEACYSRDNYCQQSDCQKLRCQKNSVRCLAGTGDFRIGLLDTSKQTRRVTNDSWCPAGVGYGDMTKCLIDVGDGVRGYDFRIFPHLTSKAKHEPGQVPCSIYRKSSANLFGKSPRLGEWGCFGAPLGEWTTLSLVVERRSSDRFKVSMKMNGVEYSADDRVSEHDPTALTRIDAVAIGYPNGRGYSYIELMAHS